MFEGRMRPVHPGEILREDYLVPLGMTATALAKALKCFLARNRLADVKMHSRIKVIQICDNQSWRPLVE